jgi:hypothetical protein
MSGTSVPVADSPVEHESCHEDDKRSRDNSRNEQPVGSSPSFLIWLLLLLFCSFRNSSLPAIVGTALNTRRSPRRLNPIAAIRLAQINRPQSIESILVNLNVAQKAIANGGHRGYVSRLAGVIPKQTPQQRNAAGERVFGDSTIVPHSIQKLVFGDQPMRTSKQKDQDSKSLRLDRQHFASFDNAELALSNLHIREGENKRLVLNHEFITPTSGNDHEPIMTMQSHGRRVHVANSAEVISNASLQVARFRKSRSNDLALASSRTTLPGKCRQFTPPSRSALPNNLLGCRSYRVIAPGGMRRDCGGSAIFWSDIWAFEHFSDNFPEFRGNPAGWYVEFRRQCSWF